MKNTDQADLADKVESNEKMNWEAPKLIKLDMEETSGKSKMFVTEFNASYGLPAS